MREEGILLETIRSSPVNSRSCHRRAYAHTPRGTTFELAGGRPIYGRSRQALGVGHCATEHPEILVYQFVLRGPRLPSVFGKARESRGERERERKSRQPKRTPIPRYSFPVCRTSSTLPKYLCDRQTLRPASLITIRHNRLCTRILLSLQYHSIIPRHICIGMMLVIPSFL